MLSDIKTWISATRTYQETCLDGFENTTSDASAKVRKILQTSIEMSSNGLVIVRDLSSLFTSLNFASVTRRRLLRDLSQKQKHNKRRKVLSSAPVLGHSIDYMWPEWVNGLGRKLLMSPNLASDLKANANVVVAQDGSGKYKTIEEALKEIPRNGEESFIIYIKEGVYNEYLVIYKWQTNVVLIGDGPTKTRITNNKNFADGVRTFKTATLSALGDFFMAKDIGIENSAGAIKHQAVAFRAQSDKSIFFNCHFDGYQDTLYVHTYRQFYRDCKISGTIDFIFGDASAFFQNCTFIVRKPLDNQNCIVTAQGRMERHQPTGIFIHKSKFVADPDYLPIKEKNKAYLGRPWKAYSKTIIMETEIGEFIQSDGWLPWEGDFGLDTCYYGEYNNVGGGSSLANRVKWRGVKTIMPHRAETFMPPRLYESDDWIKDAGIPYEPNLSSVAPAPTMSGVDEDPNAPLGAPSLIENVYSSSSTTSSSSPPSPPLPSSSSSSSSPSPSPSPSPSSNAPTPSPSESQLSTPTPTPIPTTTTTITTQPPTTTDSSPSTTLIPSPTPESIKLEIGPVKMRELERILMENDEMEEDENLNDDMSGNVPDGDEPSPARAEPPTPSPTTIAEVPSPSPSEEEVTEWLPPVVAPVPPPGEEAVEADVVPPTPPPKPSFGTKCNSELHLIFSGIVIWIALFM